MAVRFDDATSIGILFLQLNDHLGHGLPIRTGYLKMKTGLARLLTTIVAFGLIGAAPFNEVTRPAWRLSVRTFAQAQFKHPAWGYSHSMRDYALARDLATKDGAAVDDDVLFAAAMLHDMAGFAPWDEPKRDHQDVACETIVPVLQGAGFPMSKLAAVQSAIRTHMYYRKTQDAEARYLHDADGLDWLGAIGAARVIALADPKGGKPDGREAERLVESNLRDVPGTMETPAGKGMMIKRRDTLKAWLIELRSETDDLKTL